MERELVLSSYSVKDVNNNKPEDFRRKLSRTISLDPNQGYNNGLNRTIITSYKNVVATMEILSMALILQVVSGLRQRFPMR